MSQILSNSAALLRPVRFGHTKSLPPAASRSTGTPLQHVVLHDLDATASGEFGDDEEEVEELFSTT
ncbi:hypothetical protein C5D20_04660 [Rathayibacter toxicus]|nr:hypothetical protein C5D13_04710 [Rathayibacter toxicus]PPH81828.1 hypothetical protein C5D20_04660 [Rathayibacter toxicus]PPH92105.1 hypothetical protein C5D37_04670 [Rathayibacter toxicus]